MRVISLVPSWTETLLACGVNVVGRTRFCIHPQAQVNTIPVVGGTKQVDWQKCTELQADLVLMDKEENTKTMADTCPLPWYASHVRTLPDVYQSALYLSQCLNNKRLRHFAEQVQIAQAIIPPTHPNWHNVPGQLASLGVHLTDFDTVEYIIWKDPWMSASAHTFIGDMLLRYGFGAYLPQHTTPYPDLSFAQMQKEGTFYMFSSEPFPFLKHKKTLASMPISAAIVDGERYSWFGIRSVQLLLASI